MGVIKKVDEYWSTFLPDVLPKKTYLEDMLDYGTSYNSGNLFTNLYIPVRLVTSEGISDEYTYLNTGLTITELADLYWTQYSGNYLLDTSVDIGQAAPRIKTRIRAIFKKNLGKYLKLIEVGGYEYNPLWNVDGTEKRQTLSNEGINNASSTYTPTNFELEHSSAPFDSDTLKKDWTEKQNGTYTNSTTYTHNLAKNIDDSSTTPTEVDYVVQAPDTAFGYKLIGGDRMYVEKYVRQGNIGVTKTTELIRDQRETLKFSVVQEFFDDINEEILIGIYGNY